MYLLSSLIFLYFCSQLTESGYLQKQTYQTKLYHCVWLSGYAEHMGYVGSKSSSWLSTWMETIYHFIGIKNESKYCASLYSLIGGYFKAFLNVFSFICLFVNWFSGWNFLSVLSPKYHIGQIGYFGNFCVFCSTRIHNPVEYFNNVSLTFSEMWQLYMYRFLVNGKTYCELTVVYHVQSLPVQWVHRLYRNKKFSYYIQ